MTWRALYTYILVFAVLVAGGIWLLMEHPTHSAKDAGTIQSPTLAQYKPSNLLESDSKRVENTEVIEEQISPTPQRKSEDDYPMTLAVPFSNGDNVDVSYKLLDFYHLPKPNDVGLDVFMVELTDLAQNGNAAAAELLAQYLDTCAKSPRNQDDLNVAINAFSQTNHSNEQRGYVESFSSPEFVNYYYQICKDISAEDIENRNDWEEKAIELGAFQSMSDLSQKLRDTDPERHFEISKRIWDEGFIGITNSIASDYFSGRVPHLNGQPDYVTGYAYQLAGEMVVAEFLRQSDGANVSRGLSLSSQALAITSVNLSPQDIIDAEELAIQLLQENENCCISIWPAVGQ